MTIHKEGAATIAVTLVALAALCTAIFYVAGTGIVLYVILAVAVVFFGFIVRFFRIPSRPKLRDDWAAFSPCDGKVVAIEDVFEPEYLKENCRQLSIFMSPNNVHVNLYPVSGVVEYAKYHPGKYLVAWHPKSSTKNERTTVVLNTGKQKILCRQIAGAVARRIVCYAKEGLQAEQNAQMGFIKFGSRVDVFLPLTAKVKVVLGQKVYGSQTVLARFKE
ncbi:MAG: phosphatidylserine decarboxylase family protein [Prevotellaceae bacterium]|jgi:phosphatidylserine decarboxylase|nr:phosphatidylserine decarboxylase family protein [Prevotellaceae bacterium]